MNAHDVLYMTGLVMWHAAKGYLLTIGAIATLQRLLLWISDEEPEIKSVKEACQIIEQASRRRRPKRVD